MLVITIISTVIASAFIVMFSAVIGSVTDTNDRPKIAIGFVCILLMAFVIVTLWILYSHIGG